MSASEKQTAEKMVLRFMSGSGGGTFAHLKRNDIGRDLLTRIQTPGLINQGSSSLCGPASLLFAYATHRPKDYVRFITSLYESGTATLGKLKVKPGSDLRNYALPRGESPADWIGLASIRDSENWFFDYQATSDTAAGITMPSKLESWFKRAGYKTVKNETNVFFTKDKACAEQANKLLADQYNVAMFVNANMLSAREQDNKSTFPDHWVVLTSKIMLSEKSVTFTVFTWGNPAYRVPVGKKDLSQKDFLNNFYGYVACKW